MVIFDKNNFHSALNHHQYFRDFSLESIEDLIKSYPAFHSAYLVKALALQAKKSELLPLKLPKIAIQVKDRAVLHHFLHEVQKPKNQTIAETENDIQLDVILEEKNIENVQGNISTKEIDQETIIIEPVAVEETELPTFQESDNNAFVENHTTPINDDENVSAIENSLIEEAKIVQESHTDTAAEKEARRLAAMQALQEELFAAKMEKQSETNDLQEQKRIEALQKLQSELFEDKLQKESNTNASEIETEIVVTSTIEVIKEQTVTERTENNNAINNNVIAEIEEVEIEKITVTSSISEIAEKETNKEDIENDIPVNLDKEIEEVEISEIKLEIEALIAAQEEKIQFLLENEIDFKPKPVEPIVFLDWLKLTKKPSTSTQQKIEKPITTNQEDLVPFDRVAPIEAEMHQEIKQSSDPLENFISSEIIRKKRKRKDHIFTKQEVKKPKNTVIVSETLAEILMVQQKYNEAIEVYTLLSLKYPQKSIYFASQIEKLKTY